MLAGEEWHLRVVEAIEPAAPPLGPTQTANVFGPKYDYTPFSMLPPDYVSQYSLAPDGRYVYSNGYIYVVDPTTYAVTRVMIDVLGG